MLLFVSLGTLLAAVPAAAQSRCADCHFANMQESFARHLSDWDLSAHGRERVGCESCHGGDPTTFEPVRAHRDIVPMTSPASPVARANLPVTCGKCHTGPFVAFQKSRHYGLLRAGNTEGPTCSTCHGEVAAQLLSPKGLESRCANCHGPGKRQERAEYPGRGRLMQQGIRDAREQLRTAQSLIRRVDDESERADLEAAVQQAEVPLVEATHAGHAFVFDDLEERLALARERIAALLDRLANGR